MGPVRSPRTNVDLRSLTGRLPTIALPSLTDQSDWVETMTSDGGDADADAVVVLGAIPGANSLP